MTIQHLYKTVHEPVDVKLSTKQGKTYIEEFLWNGTKYIVRENCLVNCATRGRTPVWLFNVATDYGSYQLRLDTDSLKWVVEMVLSEE